ncbi:MAG: leucine-rich repeat domain-containing protein [Paludibacteraceae bacterium]|nr:leucine-rich repeat domain-containing protein [Paludibacteraceae bacterium]
MNRCSILALTLFCSMSAVAQQQNTYSVKKVLKEPLQSVLTAEEWGSATSLKVKGELTSEDFAYLRSLNIENLDLSGISNKVLPTKALYGCVRLKSVQLPDGLVSVGIASFMHCTSLNSIKLPSKLKEIHSLAFSECYSLTNVYIPKSVTDINAGAFYACTRLKYFTVESGHTKYLAKGGVLYTTDSTLAVCPAGKKGTLNVDESTLGIENAAFGGCDSLTEIVLPKKLASIGDGAFWNCKSLKTVVLPDSLNRLGKGVFLGAGLKTINWPKSIRFVPTETFKNCVNLTSIGLPVELDSIGSNSFQGCANLKDIVLPESLRRIGNNAFQGCVGLKSVYVPLSVNHIGREAFASCSSLQSVTLPAELSELANGIFAQCANLDNVVVPQKAFRIGKRAFHSCSALSAITFPIGLTCIDDAAFSNCNALTSLTIPNTVNRIGKSAFKNCKNLSNVNLSSLLTEIDEEAFMGCVALKEANIPSGVIGIADNAYRGCTALTSVSFPSKLAVIGSNSFIECPNLSSILCSGEMPSRIGATAFSAENEKKAVVYVPDEALASYKSNQGWSRFANIQGNFVLNVTRPGLMSFMIPDSMWTSVRNIKITGELNQKDLSFLSNLMHRGSHIQVLNMQEVKGLSEYGLNYNVKKEYNQVNKSLRIVYLPKTATAVQDYAFFGFEGLEKVVFSDSVKSFGSHAFANCLSLNAMNLPPSVDTIGGSCFMNCLQLESFTASGNHFKEKDGVLYNKAVDVLVAYPAGKRQSVFDIPEGVKEICEGACAYASFREVSLPSSLEAMYDSCFANCTNLTSVSIPSKVVVFGNSAFIQDTSLTIALIAEGVANVGISAFQNCTNLQNVDIPSTVNAIGDYAFWNCPGIETFTNRASVPQQAKPNIFSKNTAKSAVLYVEEPAKNVFKNNQTWSKFPKIDALSQ